MKKILMILLLLAMTGCTSQSSDSEVEASGNQAHYNENNPAFIAERIVSYLDFLDSPHTFDGIKSKKTTEMDEERIDMALKSANALNHNDKESKFTNCQNVTSLADDYYISMRKVANGDDIAGTKFEASKAPFLNKLNLCKQEIKDNSN